MFMAAWPEHSFPVGSWIIFRILLSKHGIQASYGLKYLMVVWSDHPGSLLPYKDVPVQRETLLILRSQLSVSSSKKLWCPRQGHCGGTGNKNGPQVKFHSGSPWVQQQTNWETDHTYTNRKLSSWEETLIWQSKDDVLGGKGVRKE